MARLLPVPSPGHIARVRQRLYLVEDIVAPPTAGESTLVQFSVAERSFSFLDRVQMCVKPMA
jgi:hypothetical protein